MQDFATGDKNADTRPDWRDHRLLGLRRMVSEKDATHGSFIPAYGRHGALSSVRRGRTLTTFHRRQGQVRSLGPISYWFLPWGTEAGTDFGQWIPHDRLCHMGSYYIAHALTLASSLRAYASWVSWAS
eukprot:6134151-Prorocentrum_lima.AAC.1